MLNSKSCFTWLNYNPLAETQQQHLYFYQQECGFAAAPTARMRRSSPCSHVSSNLSCDYVTCVSLFFNLRHSRDFTSPTSRRGTLHFSINMLCLSAPHIHHSIFATHSAPRIQRVFCHPQHILMSSPTDVQRPCEGSRMLSRKRKQQQDVLKQYAPFTPEQAEVWTCLLYYQTNPTVFANDNSGWT